MPTIFGMIKINDVSKINLVSYECDTPVSKPEQLLRDLNLK
jgi:hypothetical protein